MMDWHVKKAGKFAACGTTRSGTRRGRSAVYTAAVQTNGYTAFTRDDDLDAAPVLGGPPNRSLVTTTVALLLTNVPAFPTEIATAAGTGIHTVTVSPRVPDLPRHLV